MVPGARIPHIHTLFNPLIRIEAKQFGSPERRQTKLTQALQSIEGSIPSSKSRLTREG